MPRLVIDPDDENRTATSELRDEDVAAETLRFDEAGRSQDLDEEVARAYADAYDSLYFESEVNEAELDDIGELLSGTVEEVEEALEAGEFDERLDDVAAREMEGKQRTTVFDLVERREETVEYGENGAGDSDTEVDDEPFEEGAAASDSESADTDEADASDGYEY